MNQTVETHTLPDLPAMTAPAVSGGTSVMAPSDYDRGGGYRPAGRNLRRMLGYFAGGGLMLVVVVLLGEKVLMPEWRPTTLLASFESTLDLKKMQGLLPVGSDGKPIETQADYEREIGKAKAAGAAEVQVEMQKKLAAVEADKQRVISAYSTLFQRTNMIAQAGLQMEAALQQSRQQMVASSQGGRQVVSMWGDIGCALGMQGGCDAAQNARNSMVSDMDMARVDVGGRINELMRGVPDPAALIAGADMADGGTASRLPHD